MQIHCLFFLICITKIRCISLLHSQKSQMWNVFIICFRFTGIAIGLQHHEASKVWFLTIAMMIHSATSLFCVGMKFLAMKASTKSIIHHFIVQALASPIGILVGYWILVGGKLEQTLLIDGYFEALSTGTILYITFFEALSKEKQMRVLRVCRSVSMISGFIVMCVLEYFIFLERSVLSRQYDTIFPNDTEHWNYLFSYIYSWT